MALVCKCLIQQNLKRKRIHFLIEIYQSCFYSPKIHAYIGNGIYAKRIKYCFLKIYKFYLPHNNDDDAPIMCLNCYMII